MTSGTGDRTASQPQHADQRGAAPLRVCFVAPFAWPILSRARDIAIAGGAELQQVLLARELAARGHRVSMVCLDFGQPDGVVVDGVQVFRMHAPGVGWPVLRFVHPGLTSVWQAMRRADADVYYQRAAGALTAFVVAFSKLHARRSVFAGAHDLDFAPSLPLIRFGRDRWLVRWALAHVDAITTQTRRQAQACLSATGRQALWVRNVGELATPSAAAHGPVIWVGSVKVAKCPRAFVELARRFPGRQFRLVGGGEMSLIGDTASRPPNLEVIGFVPQVDVGRQFDGASVLVNTSPAEGFPNTFLQAWARGIPTLSHVDPEVSFQGMAAGLTAADIESMAAALAGMLDDPTAWAQQSMQVRRCFEALHQVDAVVDVLEGALRALCNGSGSSGKAKA